MNLKFRAVHIVSGIKYFEFGNIDSGTLLFEDGDTLPLDQCEIEQFTGCYDKNHKELYLNDIIEITEHTDENNNIIPTARYQIDWNCPFFVAINNKGDVEEIGEINQNITTLLGNIHDDIFKEK
jgi:hypothetical protein